MKNIYIALLSLIIIGSAGSDIYNISKNIPATSDQQAAAAKVVNSPVGSNVPTPILSVTTNSDTATDTITYNTADTIKWT